MKVILVPELLCRIDTEQVLWLLSSVSNKCSVSNTQVNIQFGQLLTFNRF